MQINAGFYEADITPFYDTPSYHGLSDGIGSPSSCTAGVWESEGRTVAIVGVDVAAVDRTLVDFALAELAQRMPQLSALLVGASHTHANPDCFMEPWDRDAKQLAGGIDELTPDVRERIVRSARRPNTDFYRLLQKRLVDAVWNAYQRRQPVRLVMGRATVDRVAYNRRQKMKDGTTVTHAGLGKRARDIVGNAGPVDRELVALGAVNERGDMIGAIVNFACHATVVQANSFSSDWPYTMRETVKRCLNPRMSVVFLNGCCGDVTQLDNLNPAIALEPRTERQAMILGERVGFGAVQALRVPDPEAFATLRCASEILPLRYRLTEADVREALSGLKAANVPNTNIGLYSKPLLIWQAMKRDPVARCELNAVQIGDLLLLTAPGELFARMSLDIKAASAFPYTMVAELTNDVIGYIPTPDVFGPGGGGYEMQMRASPLEVDAFEKIKKKLLEMAAAFAPERGSRCAQPA